jgi:glycosyltransferase involved in cell wall biosynthesis
MINKTWKSLSVVIPAYNENEIILDTIRECELSLKGLDHEIIIVDDGSIDGTYEKVQDFARGNSNVKIVNYGCNQGKGFAIRYGFKQTKGDIVAFIDADMNIHPKQILTFINKMQMTDADVVVGSKRHPDSKINYPLNRKIFSELYYQFVKVLFGIQVKDTQVGLKLYKRKVLEDICPMVLVKKYAFDIEILANAYRLGYKIIDAPVEINMNFDSHVNKKAIWRMFVDTCAIFYRMRIIHHYDNKLKLNKNRIMLKLDKNKYVETTASETC